jgi:lipopolysaccharide export system protein LptA
VSGHRVRRTPIPWLMLAAVMGTASATSAEPPVSEARDLKSLLQLRGDEEGHSLTIESESLELQTLPDEGRRLTFVGAVHVQQGDLKLRSDRLEADYPPQESEPSRLVASGSVQVDQPGQRAFCDVAEYARDQDRLTCRGGARLVQGCDVVAGESIEFDLSSNRVRVVGAARVVIAPREQGGDCLPASSATGVLP